MSFFIFRSLNFGDQSRGRAPGAFVNYLDGNWEFVPMIILNLRPAQQENGLIHQGGHHTGITLILIL
jgi:hypothetical protein